MELLTWLWVWDKRFFFNAPHNMTVITNIWYFLSLKLIDYRLLPIILSISMLLLSMHGLFTQKAESR